MSNKRIRNKKQKKEQINNFYNIVPQTKKEVFWSILQGLKEAHRLIKEDFERNEILEGKEMENESRQD